MREDCERGVLARSGTSASGVAARGPGSKQRPPITGLMAPHNLRTMELPEWPWRNLRGQRFGLAGHEHVIEWPEGTLPAPPQWARHRYFDPDEGDTARYLAIKDAACCAVCACASSGATLSRSPSSRLSSSCTPPGRHPPADRNALAVAEPSWPPARR